MVLENCVPVVDAKAQERIRQGVSRKVPHAFIEGDLVHFRGRTRALAPANAAQAALPHLVASKKFASRANAAISQGERINYNPRFARCFYKDCADRSLIQERLMSCGSLVVVGWKFWSSDGAYAPMVATDYCQPQDLAKAAASERSILRRGHVVSEARMLPFSPAAKGKP
jgi:hypothetical protein